MVVLSTLLDESPVFPKFIFYGSILSVKLLGMSLLTALQRVKHKAVANPEDASGKDVQVKISEDVERVRRAHRNDLENIPIFLFVAFGYTLTNPPLALAVNLFRVFTAARLAHTVVYAIYVIPQPARAISFAIGYAVTGYMAIKTIAHFHSCAFGK